MKLLINALSARRGGSKVFVKNLLPALANIDNSIGYTVILPEPADNYFPFSLPDNIVTLYPGKMGTSDRLWFEHIKIPLMFKSGKYDCYFQADDTLPPLIYLLKGKKIAVIHDSLTLLLPAGAGDRAVKIAYWKFLKWLSIRFADVPIAMSFCEKGELARGSTRLFRKLHVIYNGINHEMFNVKSVPASEKLSINLPHSYLLSVSTRNLYKNYFRLVQAYGNLVKQGKITEHLVLVGSPVWKSEEDRIKKYIEETRLGQQVHIFDSLDNKALALIYKKATAYVYPSLFDSFGFTPLEAMACGIPCAVSLFSALPEICGDSAEYFDPLDVSSMSLAIDTVVNNAERRNFLIKTGLAHVKKFDWQKTAFNYYSLITSSNYPTWSV